MLSGSANVIFPLPGRFIAESSWSSARDGIMWVACDTLPSAGDFPQCTPTLKSFIYCWPAWPRRCRCTSKWRTWLPGRHLDEWDRPLSAHTNHRESLMKVLRSSALLASPPILNSWLVFVSFMRLLCLEKLSIRSAMSWSSPADCSLAGIEEWA